MTTHLPEAPEHTITSPAASQAPTDDDRTWAMFAHLSGLMSIGGPLVVLLLGRGGRPRAVREAKEALNFQIAVALAFIAVMAIGTVLTFAFVGVVLVMLAPIVLVAGAAFALIGACEAQKTGAYRYPLTLRIIR